MHTRSSISASVSVLLLSFGAIAVGCSSAEGSGGTPGVGGSVPSNTGGSAPTGGKAGATGGSVSTGGSSAAGPTGGTSTASQTGGTSSLATGGSKSTGGSGSSGTAKTGGATASGGTNSGNTATGGNTAVASTGGASDGGASNGGASATGGAPNGGASATGGAPNGGASATGGASNGGASNGGATAATTGGTSTAGGTTATGGTTTIGGQTAVGGTSATGGSSSNNGGAATVTIPGKGCTPPAAYANLFVSLSGHTQAETDAKIAAAWAQLFNPSNANTIYYNGPGTNESYVEDIANNDVRTEGMSYGMMIAVQLDKQTEFDRIWTWVKNHMAQGTGQICWQNHTDGTKMSGGGAPDGEEYFATALIFANKRWGNTGKFNYATEAQWVLNLLRTTYFNSTYHIVQFVAGSGNTDGSYILPSFYQAWACFDTANASYWNAAITAGRNFFHSAIDSNGVIGDQSSFTGQTTKAAGPDTIRCVANIMMDHNFFNVDPWQTETYAPKYANYVTNNPQNNTAFNSAAGLLGFGLPASTGKAFVDKVWAMPIPSGQWRYYDGCWYLMAMLHLSGNFKLYY